MKLSQAKEILRSVETVNFRLPDGAYVPEHFHVTEVGSVTKDFIDCGGTVRSESVVSLQLWTADDHQHRLMAQKLLDIIALSEKVLKIADLEIEVEYQSGTIGKYALDFDGSDFLLLNKQTACLAQDNCGIPAPKQKLNLADLDKTNCCAPQGGCC